MEKSEKVSRKSKVILEINRLFKVAGKYEKIIMDSKSGSRQKAEAIKSRNRCMNKISKLIWAKLDKKVE